MPRIFAYGFQKEGVTMDFRVGGPCTFEIAGPDGTRYPAPEPALRDVKDQPVLGTLVAAIASSGADYLITGDKDLLAMADRYPVVAPAQFWAAHAGL